jgi:hypothetical protein
MSARREAEQPFQGKAASDFFQRAAPITAWPEPLAQWKAPGDRAT